MRPTAVFLTLAYCASVVMGLPTPRSEPTAKSSASEENSSEGVSVYTHCNRPGVFALTFDDGPDKYSWGLAKSLQEQGIKATFFINGANSVNVLEDSTLTPDGEKSYLEVIKQYYDAGHEIASHTFEHKNLVGLTEAQVKEQMNKNSDMIFQAIGKRVQLMRPPEGVTDEVSSRVLKELGYSNILWDVDTKDWEHKGLASEQHLVKAVMDKDVSNKTMGHISLEHDIHKDTVHTLVPWLTNYVKEKGLTFVTVSDCIGVPAYEGDNTSDTAEAESIDSNAVTPINPPVTAADPAHTVDIDLSALH